MQKELLIADMSKLSYHEPSVELWSDMLDIIEPFDTLIDRTGSVRMPFRFAVYPPFQMPKPDSGFRMTYAECCAQRAGELLALQERLDKPICLFYSGGIDSTIALISFLMVADAAKIRSRLLVAMNMDSIVEYPSFYYDFIRRNLKFTSSENMGEFFGGEHIILGGELNDQLFGSALLQSVIMKFGGAKIHQPHSADFFVPYFTSLDFSPAAALRWYELVLRSSSMLSPPLQTIFDWFWWLNFCFKWQGVFFRKLLRAPLGQRQNIDQAFINTYYHQFFTTLAFQQWSMANHDLKIKDTWSSYKFHAKDLIFQFTRDEDYRKNKQKIGSLFRILLERGTASALTADFKFLGQVVGPDFFSPQNAFG